MATKQSKQVQASFMPIDCAQAGEVKGLTGVITLTALALGDLLEMVPLPAGHVPVDCIVDSDDLDSNATPALVFSAGLITGDTPTVDEMIASTDIGQTGGIARMDAKGGTRIAPADTDRVFGLKCTAAPATFQAGSVAFTLLYRAAIDGA